MRNLFIFISICLIGFSCKKEEPSLVPVIEFVSISETEVEEFSNQLIVEIHYADFDGDLGTTDADDLTLRIKDARLSEYDWYHIPPLTPDLQELQIEGTFSVQLNPLFLLGNGAEESTEFSIQLKDRAENWSNEILTPTVIIRDSI